MTNTRKDSSEPYLVYSSRTRLESQELANPRLFLRVVCFDLSWRLLALHRCLTIYQRNGEPFRVMYCDDVPFARSILHLFNWDSAFESTGSLEVLI